MQRKYEEVMGTRSGDKYLLDASATPLTPRVREAPLPRRFRMPQLRAYNGTTDPFDHVHSFITMMDLLAVEDEILCRAFATTLDGSARKWYNRLPRNSIDTFKEFSQKFCSNFASSRKIHKSSASLMSVKQEKGETLKDYLGRFNEEQLQVQDLDDALAMVALNNGITHRECSWSLSKYPPKTFQEVLDRAHDFARAEEDYRAKRGIYGDRGDKGDTNNVDKKRKNFDDKGSKGDLRDKIDQKRSRKDWIPSDVKPRDLPRLLGLTPLNTSISRVLMEIKDKPYFQWPKPMKGRNDNRNPSKYCEYHRANGHTTDDCWSLREEVEKLIKAGHLGRYVKEEKTMSVHDRLGSKTGGISPDPNGETRVIHTIIGGPSIGGTSHNARKCYVRQLEVNLSQGSNKKPKVGDVLTPPITFGNEDLDNIETPHDDPLVVALDIGNWEVKRILVDNGSSANILSLDAFTQMGFSNKDWKPFKYVLYGFSGHPVLPEGLVTLPMKVGVAPKQVTAMVEFLVVKTTTSYNAILGRPGQNAIRAVSSAYHQKMKFPTDNGIGEVRGNQLSARKCYLQELKVATRPNEALFLEVPDLKESSVNLGRSL